jgi:uncharacterized RDD family membrane protein YckC
MKAGTVGAPQRAVTADTTDVVGRRIGALIIDSIVLGVVFVVIGLATGGGTASHGHAGVHLGTSATLVWLGFIYLYHFVCEATTGQTLGKKLLGIRVANLDGSKAGVGAVLVRTVLRLIDALPILYIVGLISVLATGRERRQRVGDIAAGTTVVAA